MKNNYFIHLLLLLALCVGQVASNAHVIGHIHSDVQHTGHLHDHAETQICDHHELEDHGSDNADVDTDCTIYHAYAGMQGVAPGGFTYAVAQLVHVPQARLHFETPVIPLAHAQPIRGPPSHS